MESLDIPRNKDDIKFSYGPKIEDKPEKEDDLRNGDELKSKDDFKNEEDLKNGFYLLNLNL